MKEQDSVLATLEILADRELTERLIRLSKTIDDDVVAGWLLTTADVLEKGQAKSLKFYSTHT
jgi:hypothetical protein